MKTYILKDDQTEKEQIEDVEIVVSEEKTTTDEDTTCLRKIDAKIEGIDSQITSLQEKKSLLQADRIEIEKEANKAELIPKEIIEK